MSLLPPEPDSPDETERPAAKIGLTVHREGSRMDRIERALEEIRSAVDASSRLARHKDFSAARLVGAIAQVLAIVFLVLALADWTLERPFAALFAKLSFTIAFQLGALTAFVIATRPRE
ncbi:MAG: hypothetical protein U1D55_15075 [Phycisphaerae bacterium]